MSWTLLKYLLISFQVFLRILRQPYLARETSTALSVMTILGVLSCALSKRFIVSPKAGWLESINIYSLIALPPANHKSLVLSACTKPLIAWERAQAAQKELEVKKQISTLKTQERIIDGLSYILLKLV